MLVAEQRWWREFNRAQLDFADCAERLEAARLRWDAWITAAMRGVEPTAWWHCNQRIEAGERWVGPNATARRVQRIVYVTRAKVLELSRRRAADLHTLEADFVRAEGRLREAVRNPTAAFGVRETARRLGLPRWTVEALRDATPLRRADHVALRQFGESINLPS